MQRRYPRSYVTLFTAYLSAIVVVGLPEPANAASTVSGYRYNFGASTYPPAVTAGAYKPPNIPTSCGTGGSPVSAGGNGVYSIPCSIAYVQKTTADGSSTLFVAYLSYGLGEALTDFDLDSAGNVYVTGRTGYSALATPGALHTPKGNLFVAKLSADGSSLLYAAVFGGESPDFSHAIRVDAAGEAWVVGETGSLQFPTVKPLQAAMLAGSQCGYQPYTFTCATGFVAKLNADGSGFVFSTYLGGSVTDVVTGLALDSSGAAYLTGQRASPDFPFTPGAFSTDGGVFVAKIAADGSDLLYSTALGGSGAAAANAAFTRAFDGIGWEAGTALAAAGDGRVIVVGKTHSADFPVLNGNQPFWTDTLCDESANPGPTGVCPSGFVAKLNATGSGLEYSTLLGGHGYNELDSVLLDSSGNAYVEGTTTSTDFPTTIGAFQPCNAQSTFVGPASTVLAEFDPNGRLVYSTYLESAASGTVELTVDPSGVVSANGVYDLATSSLVELHFPVDQTPVASPQFLARCVLNAASRVSGLTFSRPSSVGGPVAPGELLTIIGSGLGPDEGVSAKANAQGQYPTSLGGTRVLFDGVPAPVLYAQYGQVNLVAPLALMGKATTQLRVEVQGQATPAASLAVVASAVGIFTQNQSGEGQAVVLNQDGTLNSPDNPAARGSVVSLFLTGYLPDLSLADGQIAVSAASPDNSINLVFRDGFQVSLATPIYAGQAPGFINGVARVDVRIPTDAPAGAGITTGVNGFPGDGVTSVSIR